LVKADLKLGLRLAGNSDGSWEVPRSVSGGNTRLSLVDTGGGKMKVMSEENMFTWGSKTQRNISYSSTDSELTSASALYRKNVGYHNYLSELAELVDSRSTGTSMLRGEIPLIDEILQRVDNSGAAYIAAGASLKKVRHLLISELAVREGERSGRLRMVRTDRETPEIKSADGLTKVLKKRQEIVDFRAACGLREFPTKVWAKGNEPFSTKL